MSVLEALGSVRDDGLRMEPTGLEPEPVLQGRRGHAVDGPRVEPGEGDDSGWRITGVLLHAARAHEL